MVMTIMMRIGAVLAAMGFACFVAYEMIGATVDENGILHEPFGLIPIGFLLICLAMLLLLPKVISGVWLRLSGHK
ncbi:DUF3955 domain-containing protein [Aeromonas finlandensis]|uniref:DUF3955 domain-containing protein n=1 Tax=Aeromonas finlandensis TaxID=1543375 RepID=UPI00067C089B|nr:DUF3955 domain-containing protein [Aeromonas finlandensis]